jgi:hypothetical protein
MQIWPYSRAPQQHPPLPAVASDEAVRPGTPVHRDAWPKSRPQWTLSPTRHSRSNSPVPGSPLPRAREPSLERPIGVGSSRSSCALCRRLPSVRFCTNGSGFIPAMRKRRRHATNASVLSSRLGMRTRSERVSGRMGGDAYDRNQSLDYAAAFKVSNRLCRNANTMISSAVSCAFCCLNFRAIFASIILTRSPDM